MAKILPCPFCNGEARVNRIMTEYPAEGEHPAGEYEAWINIGCDDCGFEIGDEYRDEAVRNWNRRKGRFMPEGTFAERLQQAANSIEDPLPMEAEIWAAGADQDTARFVARMLSEQGLTLTKAEGQS